MNGLSAYCTSNKNFYYNEQECLEALIESLGRKANNNSGPINIYRCDLCDGFHLTSKGDPHPMLSDQKVLDRINKVRQAFDWEKKWGRF